MSVSVGAPAPDFELPGVDGATGVAGTYRTADIVDQPLVLVFYPKDNSSVCTRQLTEYTAGMGRFAELETTVWGISPQSLDEHQAFAEGNGGFGFPLLADTDKAVGEAYGVVGLLGLYRRTVVVTGAGGRVAWTHRAIGPGLTYRPIDELVAAVVAST